VSVERIKSDLGALAGLPAGRAKAARLETLASESREAGAPRLEAEVLVELSRSYEYGAEVEKLPLALGRLLRLADQYPSEIGGRLSRSIYWQLKWMTSGMINNPAVPLETVYRWLDEFESRYRQRGYSLRPVHSARSNLAAFLGDDATASAAMEAWIAARRDQMSDCRACEPSGWGRSRAQAGDDVGAIEHWAPILDGSVKCLEEPHRALSYALLPLLRAGRLDEARGAFLRGYPMVKGNVSLLTSVGHHAEFCALTGNEARGLEIVAEHTVWLTDTAVDTSRRLGFLEGVTVLLRRLSSLGHGELPVGSHTVASLLALLSEQISELCGRYDKRNGNSAVSDRVAVRLARQPLLGQLPLGLPTRLPAPLAVASTPVALAAPGETVEQLIDRAEQLDKVRHPGAAKAWARVGAVGQGLPAGVAARVAEAWSVELVGTDPAAARKSLLAAADEFAALDDRPAELRARASAARALEISGDHATATAESADLTAQAEAAFAAAELLPRHYLSVRMTEQVIAVHALDTAESRTSAEIDSVAAGLTDTLADVERYGDKDHQGRCHELLFRVAFLRQDRNDAVRHLKAARDCYLAAEERWCAARPSAMLAEFALQDGDPRAAESYARESLAHGIDVDPRQTAMIASLLVEALTQQPGRTLDLADAALAAAARWDGISEPDTLHNTFNAARAYAQLNRHGEAAALYAEAMPRVSVPYDPTGIATTRDQYGRSLRAIGRHAEAAGQFLEAARILADDPQNVRAQARLAAATAESLQTSGQGEVALAAFRRAAVLFTELGNVVSRVRCLRSAAWIEFSSDLEAGTEGAGVTAMRSVLAELQPLITADAPAELATERDNTRKQLDEMLKELAGSGSET
jgi:tetratricopeptide (TPR) repeat protein